MELLHSVPCPLLRRGQPGRGVRGVRTRGLQTRSCAHEAGCSDMGQTQRSKVVGMGSCGIDYLAQVAAFPEPDQKLRTEQLMTQGGGNCANALTAAARLGLAAALVTKIGGDALGDQILAELTRDGVDTSRVLRAEGHASPFTYIIVDRQGGTRTCIHTPGQPYNPSELQCPGEAVAGAGLAYFDGRLAEAALLLARAAGKAGVPVLVEGERLRNGLDALLQQADYIVTSANFPQEWTGAATVPGAMAAMLARLPRARCIVTTQGARGSLLLERMAAGAAPGPQLPARATADAMVEALHAGGDEATDEAAASPPACVTASGVQIREGRVRRGAWHNLDVGETGDAAPAGNGRSSLVAAAAASGEAGNASCLADKGGGLATAVATAPNALIARAMVASAAQLPKDAVQDTTGAGDAFIGALLYALCAKLPWERALRLSAIAAAANCTTLGARGGMPCREALRVDLL